MRSPKALRRGIERGAVKKNRAQERVYSFRDPLGQWDPKNQRPELWNIFDSTYSGKEKALRFLRFRTGCEMDIGSISRPKIFRLSLFISQKNAKWFCSGSIVLIGKSARELLPGKKKPNAQMPDAFARVRSVHRRHPFRSRLCREIVQEMVSFRRSGRENRAIDHDEEGSMELKAGRYF